MVAEFTVTGDVPVDARVSDCVVAVFTVTLPKLKLVALTVNCGLGATVPVPPRVTVVVLPVDELLLIAICPLAVPVAVGSNCTCSVIAWVGFSVTGRLPLTIVKPVPVIAAEFTVTGDVPVDVSVNDCVVAAFTVTLPKLKLVALTVNCGTGAAVPVPPRVTVAVLPVDELLLIVICPLAVPVAVGSNCTCSVIAWVGFSVTGKLPLTIVKPVPVIGGVHRHRRGPRRRQRQRLCRRHVHRLTAKTQGRSAQRQLRARRRYTRTAQSHLRGGARRRVTVDRYLTAGRARRSRIELYL